MKGSALLQRICKWPCVDSKYDNIHDRSKPSPSGQYEHPFLRFMNSGEPQIERVIYHHSANHEDRYHPRSSNLPEKSKRHRYFKFEHQKNNLAPRLRMGRLVVTDPLFVFILAHRFIVRTASNSSHRA